MKIEYRTRFENMINAKPPNVPDMSTVVATEPRVPTPTLRNGSAPTSRRATPTFPNNLDESDGNFLALKV